MYCDSHSQRLQLSSVQSLSRVQLFVTPWITARQASLCPSPTPRVHPNSCPLSWWCGLSVVNKTEVDGFLELCFFDDPTDGNLISGSSTFSKSSWYIWKFSVHTLFKPYLKDFEHNLAGMWNECNCAVVWTLFGIALLWDWNENWPFPVLWPLLSFPNLLAYWVQHFHSIIFQDLK